MRKRRRFYRGSVNHIYQRTTSGNNLFYGYEDFLTFFTIMSVAVRSAGIQVLAVCLMYNHFHMLVRTETMRQLSDFMNHCCSWYAREFNFAVGRSGQLLKKNFGSAPKKDDKAIRNTINYIGNNPVEKRICSRPEQYRWNFLAYAFSSSPFSEPITIRNVSKRLRRAIKAVRSMSQLNLPLKSNYILLLFKGLSDREIEQLVDCIVSEYLFIDFDAAASYYGSLSKMIEAMAYNTGSEYDIREEWDSESDMAYDRMIEVVKDVSPEMPVHKVAGLPDSRKKELMNILRERTGASLRQLTRFLCL